MSAWFEKGRPALFKALNDICSQIDIDISNENRELAEQRGDSSQESRYQELYKNAIASIKRLEDENVNLKDKVAELSRQNANTTNHVSGELAADRFNRSFSASDAEDAILAEVPTCTAPDAAASFSADDSGIQSEVNKLRMRYKALADNFKTAKDALIRRKTERNQWKDHATSLERVIRAAESEHNIEIFKNTTESSIFKISAADSSTPIQAENTAAKPHLLPTVDQNLTTEQASTKEKVDGTNLPESTQGSSQPTSTEELPPLASGQTIEVRIKSEPSSDEPSVVFTRPVKRKRDDDHLAPANSPQIKSEPLHDSSPITIGAMHPATQESIDLDDVGQHTTTPRKRQELENGGILYHTPSIPAVTPVAAYVRPDNVPRTARQIHHTSALTPLSVNQQRLVRSGGNKPMYDGRPVKRKVAGGIATVAEDGDNYGLARSELQISRIPTNGVNGSRLHALLNTPAIENSPSLRSPPKQRRHLEPGLSIPQRRQLPFDSTGRSLRSAAQVLPPSDRRSSISPQRSPVRGSKKPTSCMLRNKPLAELRADDFKINPATNEGHDFAFSEVVRDKDDRACLSGCTDMHCCGKQFRALALSQKPNPPLTAAQRQDEQRLLEQYLGDYSYRLSTMTKEEKDEVWLEAKTQELANKYGKHRHRYSRMRSPPGFWNPDFPSTQDLESDRAEAAKRERKMVAERHREAMRTGGRWLFRDE